ncbi:hypothetical protein BG015_005166 [Linnemannia schmuckeri]|uniref:Oxo-4-hydroxy-4-carboxy-5-ureidoimidazoline decarboxylase domain-containing protein n=1 Tax=Linnemannia schmuckeri TaxID=64567 RepID=A0A9P5S7B5_9FUNG|nr:hypothetical protein BG015_005166 [Linnemannia schmuckeri]
MTHAAAPVALPTIEFINTEATLQDLASAVTLLFEPAPPIVAHLYAHRPYASFSALIDETELDVINAHPRIGAAKANLSALSLIEQGYTPEDAAKKVDATATPSADDEETQRTLKRLNEEYEAKYGFKFVVFVNGRPRSVIIPVMEERIRNSTKEAEMKVAMDDMVAIARDRLKKLNAAAKL